MGQYLSNTEIKDFGLRKIAANYLGSTPEFSDLAGSDTEANDFSSILRESYLLFSVLKMPAVSLLSNWSAVTGLDNTYIGGMREFLNAIDPLMGFDNEVPKNTKSKFRNSWNNLWIRFGELAFISSLDVGMLNEVGLKLPLYLAATYEGNKDALTLIKDIRTTIDQEQGIIEVLVSFFNTVLRWVTVSDQVDGFTFSGILEDIALKDNKAFCEKYAEEIPNE